MASPKAAASVPIERAIGQALALHRAGRHDEAERAYREVLQRDPRHPHALHFYGMWLHERGKTALAIEHLERALAVSPGDPQLENNLANLYLIGDRPADAERIFLGIVARAPQAASARFNLGVLYARSKRWPQAVAQLEAARNLIVDVDVLRELGDALQQVQRLEDAVAVHREALSLAPDDADQRRRVSLAYYALVDDLDRKLADPKIAIAHVRAWLEIDPDDAIAKHTLAAYGDGDAPGRCSDDYVRRTFDHFAPSFDHVLAALRYVGVQRCVRALDAALGPAESPPTAVIVDAGCGTGALGPLVRARCARLVGIDLSPKMLDLARARGVYDEVHEAELTSFLATKHAEIDAIVCADTVIYFGDLAPLAAASVGALRPGGVLVLTVEAWLTKDRDATFRLERHGRYSHALAYLSRVLGDAGADIVATEELSAIRVEFGADVPGMIVTARRRSSS